MLKAMMSRLSGPRLKPSDLTYEEARDILERTSGEAKAALARDSDEPGILAYLSGDPKGEVRALVAANSAAPAAVDLELADDEDANVRAELARKIGRLIPGLSPSETEHLRETSIKVLERLAADSLPRVRAIIAEEIKSARNVPKHIALKLARDAELAVAAPILQYSPLLVDEDLMEIIATSEIDGVLEAIAKRHNLSADVADAVIASLDIPTVAALLANQSAQIRATTMEYIVEHATGIEGWHQPLVLRPELSLRAIRRIAGFVASSLLDQLAELHNLDDETRRTIAGRVRKRIKADAVLPEEGTEKARDAAAAAVEQAVKSKRLDDDFVVAAIESEDRTRVVLALAALADVAEAQVERILKSGNGPVITAFAWHAGLSMRTAFLLQKDVARLAPAGLVPARGGTDYPFSEDQMRASLALMQIEAKR